MKSMKGENIHFIGVGGASMSALAKFVAQAGGVVTGSDREKSAITENLEKLFPVYYGEHPEAVEKCNKVVYSSAIASDNLELSCARELKIPTLERHEFLGQLCKEFQKTVAVAGTHGKTTVTAMIAHGLSVLEENFSAHIGGETEYGNLILAGDKIFVTEACEYRQSLLSIQPHIAILLNVELDHPDCYFDIKQLLCVFLTFLEKGEIQIFPSKLIDICKDVHMNIEGYEKMSSAVKAVEEMGNCRKDGVIVFSNGKVEIWSQENIRAVDGKILVDILVDGQLRDAMCLPDKDNSTVQNALFFFATVDSLGHGVSKMKKTLLSFKGVKRRKELVGYLEGAKVVFDYAHHPTQIDNIISSFEGKNLVVFQPHTYTRTKAYFEDFVSSLSTSDKLVIMETYGARENVIEGADSASLASQISTIIAKERVEYINTHDKTLEYVISNKSGFDNILFLGAGDIYLLKDKILPYLDDVGDVEIKDVMKVF